MSARGSTTPSKRSRDDIDDSSSEDDFGPTFAAEAASKRQKLAEDHDDPRAKQLLQWQKDVAPPPENVLQALRTAVDRLPKADRYSKSLMHKTDVCLALFTPHTDFLVTASMDGVVKFWKKVVDTVEFVKEFKAHSGAVKSMSVSYDGKNLATAGPDNTVKLFDVENFDMYGILKLDFEPKCICWVHGGGAPLPLIAVSSEEKPRILIYDGRGIGTEPIHEVKSLHEEPVNAIVFNSRYSCAVSADEGGQIQYWSPKHEFKKPATVWKWKSKTDLVIFKRLKHGPVSMVVSPDCEQLATLSLPERIIRVFDFASAKVLQTFDESLEKLAEMQKAGFSLSSLDFETPVDKPRDPAVEAREFNRRLQHEQELEQLPSSRLHMNVLFDESSRLVVYGTLYGITVRELLSGHLVRVYGTREVYRPSNLALYQGVPQRKAVLTAAMAASDNPLLQEASTRDAMLVATGFSRTMKGTPDAEGNARFYMTTNDNSYDVAKPAKTRDVRNEKLASSDPTNRKSAAAADKPKPTADLATLHTSEGDIQLRLFPSHAPLAVENFATHARAGYYNGVIFHRVIKKFMIQTGDPLGDGTGGESIWGKEFRDEIVPTLVHDKYTLSMANAGPNTNGSQFFITTAKTDWLDGKHTIFGRVVGGFEVVHAIENVRAHKERPLEDVRIINIDVE